MSRDRNTETWVQMIDRPVSELLTASSNKVIVMNIQLQRKYTFL